MVIDGCEVGCARGVLEQAEVPLRGYLVITDLDIDKNKNMNLKRAEIDQVKEAVRRLPSGTVEAASLGGPGRRPAAAGSPDGAEGIFVMPGWGKIFADPVMQGLKPNPELMDLIPGWQAAGCRRVLDAGCGVGRHLFPCSPRGSGSGAWIAMPGCWSSVRRASRAFRRRPPPTWFRPISTTCLSRPVFDLAMSINVINHGYAATLPGLFPGT